MTFRADWGSKRMLSWKANSAWRCPTVLTIRSFRTILTKNPQKMTLKSKQCWPLSSKEPLFRVPFRSYQSWNRETASPATGRYTSRKEVRWVEILSYVKLKFNCWSVFNMDRLWCIQMWSVFKVGLLYPIITGHGKNTATGRAGGKAC